MLPRFAPRALGQQLQGFVSGFEVLHYANGLESSSTPTAVPDHEKIRLRERLGFRGSLFKL
jgi:hypothetical protein